MAQDEPGSEKRWTDRRGPTSREGMRPKGADWWHPQWLIRPPTAEEQRWAYDWMKSRDRAYEAEWLVQWKVIDDMLTAAGYEIHAGAGPESDDLVRELIHRANRTDKIAEMHRQGELRHGMTSGYCTECGLVWPCPTWDWARPDSDRGLLSSWDREDE